MPMEELAKLSELAEFYIKNLSNLLPELRRIARWHQLEDLENDIAQDVFFKIHRLKPIKIRNPEAYIIAVFANQCRSVLRSKKEENYGVFPNPALFLEEETPLSHLIQQEDFEILRRRIEWLNPSRRNAIKSYCLEQLLYKECAESLQTTRASVRGRVCRGLKELRIAYGL